MTDHLLNEQTFVWRIEIPMTAVKLLPKASLKRLVELEFSNGLKDCLVKIEEARDAGE